MLSIMMEQKKPEEYDIILSGRKAPQILPALLYPVQRWRKPSSNYWTHGCASASATSPADDRRQAVSLSAIVIPEGGRHVYQHVQIYAQRCASSSVPSM